MKSKSTVSIPMESQNGTSAKSFNSNWNMMKGMVFFFGIIVVIVLCGSLLFSYQAIDAAQNRAFVVTNQGTVLASSAYGDASSRKIEVENHVRLFFSTMYSFDERTFRDNVEKGLNLIGNDGKLIYQGYTENSLYEDLVKSNGIVNTTVDSLEIDMNTTPYRVRSYARQSFETPAGMVQNFLWTSMTVKNVSRSSKNVNGLLIENFKVTNNSSVQ